MPHGPLQIAVDDPAVVVGLARVQELEVPVVAVDDDGSTVVCRHPAVEARIAGRRLDLGEEITVRVRAADPVERRVDLEPI